MKQQNEHLVCHVCEKIFLSVSNKNRHLIKIHDQQPTERKIPKHVKCPLCSDKDKISFGSHANLLRHLEQIHSLTIQQSTHHFSNKVDFEAWRSLSNRNVDYVLERTVKNDSAEEYIYYNCNRSNTKGFLSQCSQRNMKKGGSIKISGLCPSRISVKINSSGVAVKYIETHVGHNDKLRSKRKHAVASIQKTRSDFVEGLESDESRLCIDEPSSSKIHNQNEVESFIQEITESQNIISIDPSTKREIVWKDTMLKLKALDDEEFYKMVEIINKTLDSSQDHKTQRVEKRKIEKQLYYPNKK